MLHEVEKKVSQCTDAYRYVKVEKHSSDFKTLVLKYRPKVIKSLDLRL